MIEFNGEEERQISIENSRYFVLKKKEHSSLLLKCRLRIETSLKKRTVEKGEENNFTKKKDDKHSSAR